MNAYDLVYAPINFRSNGSLMDYAEKLDALDAAETALTTAISNLRKAADALEREGWKRLSVAGHLMEEDQFNLQRPEKTPLDLNEWPSLDQIKKLAEAYWSAFAAAQSAYDALSPAMKRRTQAPGKPPLS